MNIKRATLKTRQTIFFISIVLNIYLLTDSGYLWPRRLMKLGTPPSTTRGNIVLANNANKANNACNKSEKRDDRSQMELVFVGGFPRSGTTLMRTILDVHPNVSCGPETRILPLFLDLMTKVMSNSTMVHDMNNRYIDNSTIDKAASLFIEHIAKNRDISRSQLMCIKDPRNLLYMEYLHRLFPNAKFVYMIRDARAAVYSYLSREFPLSRGYFVNPEDADKIKEFILDWDKSNDEMYRQCRKLGIKYCKKIKYELLVEHPVTIIRSLVEFLNISWTKDLLNHEGFVAERVKTSDLEWSTHQIVKPIYNESISAWRGQIKYDLKFISQLRMQRMFGYTFN